MEKHKINQSNKLTFDVYRSTVLGISMKFWGMPEFRVNLSKEINDEVIELYYFPPNIENPIHRYLSIGMGIILQNKQENPHEWFVAFENLEESEIDQGFQFFSDICAYNLENRDQKFTPRLFEVHTPSFDNGKVEALLIDEARGEPDDLQKFNVLKSGVELQWVVPIFKNEMHFILERGIEDFDIEVMKQKVSLIDKNRQIMNFPE